MGLDSWAIALPRLLVSHTGKVIELIRYSAPAVATYISRRVITWGLDISFVVLQGCNEYAL